MEGPIQAILRSVKAGGSPWEPWEDDCVLAKGLQVAGYYERSSAGARLTALGEAELGEAELPELTMEELMSPRGHRRGFTRANWPLAEDGRPLSSHEFPPPAEKGGE
jgi:hypothetical protein